jgi:hypothetical protein
MAVIPYAIVPSPDIRSFVIKWTAVTEADTCAPVAIPTHADRSVQVNGTFGGATAVIQGSNDGTNYLTLNNPADAALSFSSAGLEAILESTAYIKPLISGGTGQTLNIYIHMRGDK